MISSKFDDHVPSVAAFGEAAKIAYPSSIINSETHRARFSQSVILCPPDPHDLKTIQNKTKKPNFNKIIKIYVDLTVAKFCHSLNLRTVFVFSFSFSLFLSLSFSLYAIFPILLILVTHNVNQNQKSVRVPLAPDRYHMPFLSLATETKHMSKLN